MASLVKKRCFGPESCPKSDLERKRYCKGAEMTDTVTIPGTPIEKLRASFPFYENQILEQALMYCNMDTNNASIILQQKMFSTYAQQNEDGNFEVKFEAAPKKSNQRANLIEIFLESINQVQTQDEAENLTEILLKRYKDIFKNKSENASETNALKNEVLKKTMRSLTDKYVNLVGSVKEEQVKISKTNERINNMVNEIEYCKYTTNSLTETLKSLYNAGIS